MKRKIALVLLLVLALTGCKSGKTEPTAPPETQMPTEAEKPAAVGISMPEEAEPWQSAGTILCRELEAAGYTVTLVFGDGTAAGQEQQIAGLLEKQTDCLIVTPVDAVLPEKITETAKYLQTSAWKIFHAEVFQKPFCQDAVFSPRHGTKYGTRNNKMVKLCNLRLT